MKTVLRFLTAAALMLSAQAFAQTPPPGVYMTMGSQLIGILTDGSYCMVVQNDVKNGAPANQPTDKSSGFPIQKGRLKTLFPVFRRPF